MIYIEKKQRKNQSPIIFQLVDFRNWCHNEVRINKSDLSNIATARRTFAQAEKDMLPEGVRVDEGAAHVPLQNLLEHTLTRY